MPGQIGLFDVDTQVDFMDPRGALYVPGADQLAGNLTWLITFAHQHRLPVLSSVDAHAEQDPEFAQFPPHCRKGTDGQLKMAGTILTDAVVIENRNYGPQLHQVVSGHQQVILEKQTLDVFSNPNTMRLLQVLGVDDWVVCGVATDYCVKSAALGLLGAGYHVTVVEDAIAAVNLKPGDGAEAVAQMRVAGAEFTPTAALLRELEARFRTPV